MGDPKNIKTGSSLTGGKGYLTSEEAKKVAPVVGTGAVRVATSKVIQNKTEKERLLKETGGY